MNTTLYFIRHGETEWNRLRRIQGHSDTKLSPLGVKQAERLAAHLAARRFSAVYTSDLKRAHDTARRLADAAGSPLYTLPSLRERCYGEWEGLTYEEIRARFQEEDEALYGIESFEAMQQRAMECLTGLALAHPGETIAAISHGGLINSFLHLVTDGKLGTGVTRIDNTGICVLVFRNGQWEVEKVNAVGHLEDFPPTDR